MKREVVVTRDGSHTISIPEQSVTYHSIHGAIQESAHVYIRQGYHYKGRQLPGQPTNILEVGFGTGLNAFLTAIEAEATEGAVDYTAIEPFPLTPAEFKELNYADTLNHHVLFEKLHLSRWDEEVSITAQFTLTKHQTGLQQFSTDQLFHIIYYDAFAPSAQPELWTKEIFEKLFNWLSPGGILVTYCSKGDVRRAMMGAGLMVERLPGPPGKREMLRATKPL